MQSRGLLGLAAFTIGQTRPQLVQLALVEVELRADLRFIGARTGRADERVRAVEGRLDFDGGGRRGSAGKGLDTNLGPLSLIGSVRAAVADDVSDGLAYYVSRSTVGR